MHGLPKLLVVDWLGLSVAVRVRVRAWNREWIFHRFFFSLVLKRETPSSWPWISQRSEVILTSWVILGHLKATLDNPQGTKRPYLEN